MGGWRRVGPRRVGPRRVGARRVGGPKGGGPEISRFFSVSHHQFTLSLSHCVSSRGFLVMFGGPPGFHTTSLEPKRAHLRVPVFKTPPKFNEKTPREGRKERILRRDREKKSEILGGPGEGRPREGRPREGRSKGRAVQGKGPSKGRAGPGKGRSREGPVQGRAGPGKGRSREGRVPGRAGPGKAGPGKAGPGKAGPGKCGPGKGGPGGTEQTKTLKPPHRNRETNTHATQTHTNTHEHTHKQVEVVWPKSVWPKSVLAKVGLAKVGHDPPHRPNLTDLDGNRNHVVCGRHWRWKVDPPFSLSSGSSTVLRQRTGGMTMRGSRTRSSKVREGSRATRLPALYALGQHRALAIIQ